MADPLDETLKVVGHGGEFLETLGNAREDVGLKGAGKGLGAISFWGNLGDAALETNPLQRQQKLKEFLVDVGVIGTASIGGGFVGGVAADVALEHGLRDKLIMQVVDPALDATNEYFIGAQARYEANLKAYNEEQATGIQRIREVWGERLAIQDAMPRSAITYEPPATIQAGNSSFVDLSEESRKNRVIPEGAGGYTPEPCLVGKAYWQGGCFDKYDPPRFEFADQQGPRLEDLLAGSGNAGPAGFIMNNNRTRQIYECPTPPC